MFAEHSKQSPHLQGFLLFRRMKVYQIKQTSRGTSMCTRRMELGFQLQTYCDDSTVSRHHKVRVMTATERDVTQAQRAARPLR